MNSIITITIVVAAFILAIVNNISLTIEKEDLLKEIQDLRQQNAKKEDRIRGLQNEIRATQDEFFNRKKFIW